MASSNIIVNGSRMENSNNRLTTNNSRNVEVKPSVIIMLVSILSIVIQHIVEIIKSHFLSNDDIIFLGAKTWIKHIP